ncbi:hypothetical protein SPRG_04649 [Saprolegnia parasitica CBS 223.65]|uniref:Protein CASP n=1 Tax=Saprolegnia parasitica (strain CBS 223.65) TaxID=695850 RepID=A0A067CJT4_SAPPC|nr:hypothetical protein SPRG_04649 [Saprolegnia parasitica CBS 223.65]KDO30748.1 hypothetical protein SPRG_04649 [Saprolegnia parasitica CBS 223.65]|eukprot:XP_012198448.1 hypothetical protein SPRG_04649 [Saprolegnia parasitica CBS 223.65]
MNPTSRALLTTVSMYWKGFDLDSKRAMLDAQGGSMQEQKEASLKSRKALAEHTKRFRKLATEPEKAANLPGLLKAYQEEIDTLTKRAKFSDNAFFTLYKALYEAPDPVPALEAALEASAVVAKPGGDADVDALRKEIEAYEAEFAMLKNQDITIRNLEAKIAGFTETLESMVEEKVHERCRDIEYNATLREDEMAAMVGHLTKSMEQARQDRDDALAQLDRLRSEVLQAKQRNEQLHQVHAKEMASWVLESDRLRALQLENQLLKDRVQSPGLDPHEPLESQKAMEWELKLAQREAQISQLTRDLLAAEARAPSLEANLAAALADLSALTTEVTHLRLRPTIEAYEDLLAQVTSSAAAPNGMLETLKAEHALTVASLEDVIATQQAKLTECTAMIRQLEDAAMEEPSAPLLQDVLASSSAEGSDLKLVSILRTQRDRLRDRLKESDRELHKETEKVRHVTNRLAQLEAENVDLVQKLRFLSTANSNSNNGDLEAAPSTKYARLYEEKMSPFAQFKQLESQSRFAKLNTIDKILLTSARMLLSHPVTRLFMLLYLLFLHTLVALTIYMAMHMCDVSNDS